MATTLVHLREESQNFDTSKEMAILDKYSLRVGSTWSDGDTHYKDPVYGIVAL